MSTPEATMFVTTLGLLWDRKMLNGNVLTISSLFRLDCHHFPLGEVEYGIDLRWLLVETGVALVE